MAEPFWYPSVTDVLDIHDDIVSEYPETSAGIRNRGDVEFALDYIREGGVGETPESVHEKAFHLLRLLVATHPFVDGNKRTALNTTAVFYLLNGYRFEYDDEIRVILKQFATDEATVDTADVIHYLHANTERIDVANALSQWREELVQYGLDQLTDGSSNPND